MARGCRVRGGRATRSRQAPARDSYLPTSGDPQHVLAGQIMLFRVRDQRWHRSIASVSPRGSVRGMRGRCLAGVIRLENGTVWRIALRLRYG